MSPFLQLCIELNIDEGTCDRAVAEALLYLEQIRTGLIVVKSLGMTEAVERVAAGFPPQFPDPFLKNTVKRSFCDMRAWFLSREKPVIRPGVRITLFSVPVKDTFQSG